MAISDYKRLTVDLLAASVGYSVATVIPKPTGSSEFYVYTGLEEPAELDGIWFKTADEFDMTKVQIKMFETQNDLQWVLGNDMPLEDYRLAGASVGTKVYICGGVSNGTATRIYDTTTGVWTTGNDMPLGDYRLAGASVGTKVYMCGGSSNSTATRIYDTTTGVWTTGNAMPLGDERLAGASVGTKVYMCGGYGNKTATRILTTDDSVDYDEQTVVLVVGYLTNTSSNSILTNKKVIKLNNNIRIHIADGWIVKNGNLNSYETYWGDGVKWNLLKTI